MVWRRSWQQIIEIFCGMGDLSDFSGSGQAFCLNCVVADFLLNDDVYGLCRTRLLSEPGFQEIFWIKRMGLQQIVRVHLNRALHSF